MQLNAITHLITIDWIIFGIVLLSSAIDTWRSGSSRSMAVALALPLAFTFYSTMSSAVGVGSLASSGGMTGALVFLGLTAGAFFVCRKIVGAFYPDEGVFPVALITGIATTVLLAAFWSQTLVLHTLWKGSGTFASIFSANLNWWYSLAAYAALVYIRM
jgi:hypothetical protein